MLQDMPIDRRALLKYAATLPIISTVPRLARAADDASEAKADYTLAHCPGLARTGTGQNDKDNGLQRQSTGPGIMASRGTPGADQRYQRCRLPGHHPLARALSACFSRRGDRRRLTDHSGRTIAHFHPLHAQAEWHALVSQPRDGDDGPHAQHLFRRVRVSYRRTGVGRNRSL